jgi:hypothetical protein
MSNYTTQTAALKAVTIDTAKLDAKQIDTKKLFINGELFDPSDSGVRVWNGKFGDCSSHENTGALHISLFMSLGIYGYDWMPHKLYINNKEVMCKTEEGAGDWIFYIAEPNDDFTQLFGGITDNTPVTMYYSFR